MRHLVSTIDIRGQNYEIEQIGTGQFNQVEFPPVFALKQDMQIVIPLKEGMLIPREFSVENFPKSLRYGGGWSMAFIGVVDGEKGWMEIVETPNDFEIVRARDKDGRLFLKNRWISEKGRIWKQGIC